MDQTCPNITLYPLHVCAGVEACFNGDCVCDGTGKWSSRVVDQGYDGNVCVQEKDVVMVLLRIMLVASICGYLLCFGYMLATFKYYPKKSAITKGALVWVLNFTFHFVISTAQLFSPDTSRINDFWYLWVLGLGVATRDLQMQLQARAFLKRIAETYGLNQVVPTRYLQFFDKIISNKIVVLTIFVILVLSTTAVPWYISNVAYCQLYLLFSGAVTLVHAFERLLVTNPIRTTIQRVIYDTERKDMGLLGPKRQEEEKQKIDRMKGVARALMFNMIFLDGSQVFIGLVCTVFGCLPGLALDIFLYGIIACFVSVVTDVIRVTLKLQASLKGKLFVTQTALVTPFAGSVRGTSLPKTSDLKSSLPDSSTGPGF
mmetsp:Transcript_28454/g.45845  ORF Transcript_28454/g.45845 Transcript_28454/m.45845 type:complete len:372 (-) Transcript_28454:1887-3002(-)